MKTLFIKVIASAFNLIIFINGCFMFILGAKFAASALPINENQPQPTAVLVLLFIGGTHMFVGLLGIIGLLTANKLVLYAYRVWLGSLVLVHFFIFMHSLAGLGCDVKAEQWRLLRHVAVNSLLIVAESSFVLFVIRGIEIMDEEENDRMESNETTSNHDGDLSIEKQNFKIIQVQFG
jgi:hypothetical protein